MDKEFKAKLCSQDKWYRLLYMLLFGVVFFIATWSMLIVGAIAIIQFIFNMFLGNPNKQLLSFSNGFCQYIYQVVKYLTFVSEEKPFPLSSWPKSD